MGPRSNLNSRNALPGAAAAAPPAAAAATSAAVSAATAAADRAAPAAVAAAARSAAGNAAAAAAAPAAVGCGVGAADRLACPPFRRFLQGPEGVQQMRFVDAGAVTCPAEVMTCRQASRWGSALPSPPPDSNHHDLRPLNSTRTHTTEPAPLLSSSLDPGTQRLDVGPHIEELVPPALLVDKRLRARAEGGRGWGKQVNGVQLSKEQPGERGTWRLSAHPAPCAAAELLIFSVPPAGKHSSIG